MSEQLKADDLILMNDAEFTGLEFSVSFQLESPRWTGLSDYVDLPILECPHDFA